MKGKGEKRWNPNRYPEGNSNEMCCGVNQVLVAAVNWGPECTLSPAISPIAWRATVAAMALACFLLGLAVWGW